MLPQELINYILLWNIHPIAEIMKPQFNEYASYIKRRDEEDAYIRDYGLIAHGHRTTLIHALLCGWPAEPDGVSRQKWREWGIKIPRKNAKISAKSRKLLAKLWGDDYYSYREPPSWPVEGKRRRRH